MKRYVVKSQLPKYKVSWNQHIMNADFSEGLNEQDKLVDWYRDYWECATKLNPDGTVTISGVKNINRIVSLPRQNKDGVNVFAVKCNIASVGGGSWRGMVISDSGVLTGDTLNSGINTSLISYGYPSWSNENIGLGVTNDVSGEITLIWINGYDLTQMFGAGNEPSDVATFESWLAENHLDGYQPYNSGEIKYLTWPSWIPKIEQRYVVKDSAKRYISVQDEGTIPPNNEIWYWADKKITLYSSTNVVSHIFANGKGVVTFGSDITNTLNWLRNTAITNVALPSGITSIGNYTFSGCANLALTSLPSGITSIGIGAFNGCANLALTSLPSGITTIGDSAFRSCTSIASLTIDIDTPPELGTSAFIGTSFPIYVPAASVDAYKVANGWSTYADKIYPIL